MSQADAAKSHAHAGPHSHDMEGTWQQWMVNPILRALLVVLFLAAISTVVGLIVVWPDGSGRTAIDEDAAALGLRSERYEATVDSVFEDKCGFSSEGNEWDCRSIIAVPAEVG